MLTNILTVIRELFYNLYIPEIRIWDVLEIAIIVGCLYYMFKHIKNTRAWIFAKGIMFMFALYVFSFICGFNAITVIFEKTLSFVIIGIILVLQPELRKLFESMGMKKVNPFKNLFKKKEVFIDRFSSKTAEEITEACKFMGSQKTGALIVLEKDIPLAEFISSGIPIDAVITKELLINTFEHNTPLHDGAVVIQNDRLVAATCYLPLSKNNEINKAYGTRHRAAIGMAEATDAFIIVVSEETGHISVAYMNKLYENLDPNELLNMLNEFRKTEKEVKKQNSFSKLTRNIIIKIISLILGVILWLILINVYNPLMSVKFENIPITITNETLAKNVGQTYSIKGGETVDVVIRDKRIIVESINPGDIYVYADMTNLSAINTIPLRGSVTSAPDATFDFGANGSVQIEFEDIISKDFELQIEPNGTAMPGYYVNEIRTNVSTVSVVGPRSQINMIGKVVLPVDINGVSSAFNSSSTPVVYDVNGEVMNKVDVSTKFVYVSGYVYRTKIVNLDLQINVSDKLTYTVNNFDYNPKTVRIAARDEVLNTLDSVGAVVNINIEESGIVDGKYVTEINLADYLVGDFALVNQDTTVSITLDISHYIKKTMNISPSEISYVNIPNDKEVMAMFTDINFDIWVPEEWADTITVENIDPKIDFSNVESGKQDLTIMFISDLIKFESDVIGTFNIMDKVD